MEPTPQEIQELRDLILKKVEEDGSSIPGNVTARFTSGQP